jgi:hypothetical protein
MKQWTHEVKLVLDPPGTLPWCIYRVAVDATGVRNLVAMAMTEDIARRIAAMLDGR